MRLLLIFALFLAQANAAITYVASGTGSGVTSGSACAPGIPAGIANNDILITVLHSRVDTTHTCATNCTGWAEIATQTGGATEGRVSVWWKRTSGSESAPTFGGPASESYACRIFAFRGVRTDANPGSCGIGTIDVAAGGGTSPYTGAQITTSVTDCMMVFVGGAMDNAVWGAAGGSVNTPTASDTGCTTENLCVANGSGTDNSVFLSYDSSPVGTTADLQAAPTNAKTLGTDPGRQLVFALEPAPVSCAGTRMLVGVGC